MNRHGISFIAAVGNILSIHSNFDWGIHMSSKSGFSSWLSRSSAAKWSGSEERQGTSWVRAALSLFPLLPAAKWARSRSRSAACWSATPLKTGTAFPGHSHWSLCLPKRRESSSKMSLASTSGQKKDAFVASSFPPFLVLLGPRAPWMQPSDEGLPSCSMRAS